MTRTGLYRRLLGSDFDRLPPALRAFHDAADGASGTGVFRVQRGSGAVARALARALRLPPVGDHVPVGLRVTTENEYERWERTFGTRRLCTRQRLEDGRLIERVGAATLAFHVTADEHGMQFRSTGFAWLGIPLPRRLAVEVDAVVRGFETYWEVAVIVRAPRVGVVTSYEGRITPTPQ